MVIAFEIGAEHLFLDQSFKLGGHMIKSKQLALLVDEQGPKKFHFTVIEAVGESDEFFVFSIVNVGRIAYSDAYPAWFGGLEALLKIEKNREDALAQVSASRPSTA
ncbi:hypothetical protein [Variovorax sp. LT1R20]|uniref:hypothetical protein n=1 Tax=Variovorax sp. LT1R20 TaxID=3443729 RepID=UPI003F498C90